MKKIYVIAGLPGSGKTTLSEKFKAKGYHIIDDLGVIVKNSGQKVQDFLIENKIFDKIVINDCFLCTKNAQEMLIKILNENFKEYDIKWIFFENNKENSLINARGRGKHFVNPTIEILNKNYEISEKITTYKKLKTKKYF